MKTPEERIKELEQALEEIINMAYSYADNIDSTNYRNSCLEKVANARVVLDDKLV